VATNFGSPSSALLNGGQQVFAWEYYGDKEGVSLRVLDAQGQLLKSANVISGEAETPALVATADGGFMMVWSVETRTSSSIVAQRYNSQGETVGSQLTLATSKQQILEDATITLLPNGSYLVSWTADQEVDETTDLQMQLFNSAGKPQGDILTLTHSDDGTFVSEQTVHLNADGSITLTWSAKTRDGFYYDTEIFQQKFELVGGRLQASDETPEPQLLLQNRMHNSTEHVVVKTADGFLLLETTYPFGYGMNGTLTAHQFDADFNELGEAIISTSAGTPQLTALGDGSFVAAWSQHSYAGETLNIQRLDASGEPIGEPQIIQASFSSNTYGALQASILPVEGGFTLTWSTMSDNGASLMSQQFNNHGETTGPLINLLTNERVYETVGDGHTELTVDGKMGDFQFSQDADGNLVVSNGNDGAAIAGSVRELEFTDGELSVNNGRQQLESGTNGALEPSSVQLAGGGQVIVWQQSYGDFPGIRVQLYGEDGALLREILPADFAPGVSYEPSVAAFNEGFIVLWTSETFWPTSSHAIYAQRYDDEGEPVGSNIVIADSDELAMDDARLLPVGDGFVVAWSEQQRGDGAYESQAYVRLFDAEGKPNGQPIALDPEASSPYTTAEDPVIAALENGFAVFWEREFDTPKEGDGDVDIYMQRFDVSGERLGEPELVNTIRKGDQLGAEVTRLENGTVVVTWTSMTYKNDTLVTGDIYMRRYSPDGRSLDKKEVKVNTSKDINGEPSVAALKSGGYVVTWATSEEHENRTESVLYAQVFDANGKKVGGEIIVARDDSNLFPSVVGTADGGFQILWEESEFEDGYVTPDSFSEIHSQRYDANGQPIGLQLQGDAQDNQIRWSGSAAITLDGGAGNDELYGNSGNDTLIGGTGNDLLDGGAGADLMQGGAGDDVYYVDNKGDRIIELANEGVDTVHASVDFTLGDNLENLVLTGTGNLKGTGNALDNQLTGNAGKNVLNGGAGNDRLDGAGGVDTLVGGQGDDTYVVDLISKGVGAKAKASLEDKITEKAGEGYDTLELRADFGDDYQGSLKLTLAAALEALDASKTGSLKLDLTGNKFDNLLIGNSGDNTLNGGAGNDVLYAGDGGINVLIGGAGQDTMYAGTGQDTFRFTNLKDLGFGEGSEDVIHGFQSGVDKLDFKALKKYELLQEAGAEFTKTKQLSWAVDGDDVVVYINSDKDLDADYSVRLVGISELSADDFILV
jgi:serralysin